MEEPKFSTDAEYVALAERLFQQRLRLRDMEDEAQRLEFVWAGKGVGPADRALRRAAVGELVADVAADAERLEHALLAPFLAPQPTLEGEGNQAHWEPRAVRVARRYGMSAKELLGLLFAVVWNAGSALKPLQGAGADARRQQLTFVLCRACAMGSSEAAAFFSAARAHVRDDVFAVEADDAFRFESAFLEMRGSVVRALLGVPLTTEELLAVDKTPLGDILQEDRAAGVSVVVESASGGSGSKNGKNKKTTSSRRRGCDDDDDDDPNKEDAERILKELGIQMGGEDDDEGRDDDSEEETKESDGEENETSTTSETTPAETTTDLDVPEYKNDLEYLEDEFKVLAARVLERESELQDGDLGALGRDKRNPATVRRELAARSRLARARVSARLQRTAAVQPGWEPRIAALVRARGLDAFERDVLLLVVGWAVSSELQQAVRRVLSGSSSTCLSGLGGARALTVEAVLAVLCASLEEAVGRRRCFYRSGRLVAEDLVQLHEPAYLARSSGDVLDYGVSVDRRLLDHVLGLDAALGDTVDGSELFAPQVGLDAAVLPAATKARILGAVADYARGRAACAALGVGAPAPYGRGLCLLFYGPSGTGKTLTAHGVAHALGKRVLQVCVPAAGDGAVSREALRLLFREARTHDAVVFFDECEHLFEARGTAGAARAADTAALLTELERGDALVVLATNRHEALDPALHRRVGLAVEFAVPDFQQRREIWRRHVPPRLALAPDVDWDALAMGYELTGGLIKNAVLAAAAHALARGADGTLVEGAKEAGAKEKSCEEEETSVEGAKNDTTHNGPNALTAVTQKDLEDAAREQLLGHLRLGSLGDAVAMPQRPLARLVAPRGTRRQLRALVRLEKARRVLHARWGLAAPDALGTGAAAAATTVVVVAGPPGTGKHLAAEAVAFELGRPLHEVSCGEIAASKVGAPRLLEGLFREARGSNAVLVLADADTVFAPVGPAGASSASSASVAAQQQQLALRLLLHHMLRYGGLVFVLCTTRASATDDEDDNGDDDGEDEDNDDESDENEREEEKIQKRAHARLAKVLDAQLLRAARHTVLLDVLKAPLRAQLWRQLVPPATPLAPDVDFARLAQDFPLSGGAMLAALMRACEAAVLAGGAPLSMQMLVDACRAEQANSALNRPSSPPSFMYQ